jgi:hypothetical protein
MSLFNRRMARSRIAGLTVGSAFVLASGPAQLGSGPTAPGDGAGDGAPDVRRWCRGTFMGVATAADDAELPLRATVAAAVVNAGSPSSQAPDGPCQGLPLGSAACRCGHQARCPSRCRPKSEPTRP